MQGLLTRVIFLRSNIEESLRELHHLRRADNESDYLHNAAEITAGFLHAARFTLSNECTLKTEPL